MPKTEFFDYEPLSRQGSIRQKKRTESSVVPPMNMEALSQSSTDPATSTGSLNVRTNAAARLDDARDTSVLKHGHTLSFIGLFVFTFLVYFRPYEVFPSLVWLTGSAFWVATFTLFCFIPTQLGLENRITIRTGEVNAVLLLVLAGLLSIPLALDKGKAWGAFVDYLKVIVMFIVMINVVRTQRRLNLLIGLVLLVSCVLSIGAIYDFETGNLALKGTRIAGVLGGLFENPNDIALHLVTIVPISAALLISAKSILKKMVLAVCTLLMTGGVFVTFSRGGFLGLVCVFLVLAWKLARRNRALVVVGAILLVGIAVAVAPSSYRTRISTTNDDSAIARTDDLKRSIFIALHHPVFGVGMNNYILFSNSNKATHNSYTQVAAEMGFPALAVYIVLLLISLKSLRKIEKRALFRSLAYYVSIGLQASLVGFMVSSFFASVVYLWYLYYLVGYTVALARLSAGKAEVTTNEKGQATQSFS